MELKKQSGFELVNNAIEQLKLSSKTAATSRPIRLVILDLTWPEQLAQKFVATQEKRCAANHKNDVGEFPQMYLGLTDREKEAFINLADVFEAPLNAALEIRLHDTPAMPHTSIDDCATKLCATEAFSLKTVEEVKRLSEQYIRYVRHQVVSRHAQMCFEVAQASPTFSEKADCCTNLAPHVDVRPMAIGLSETDHTASVEARRARTLARISAAFQHLIVNAMPQTEVHALNNSPSISEKYSLLPGDVIVCPHALENIDPHTGQHSDHPTPLIDDPIIERLIMTLTCEYGVSVVLPAGNRSLPEGANSDIRSWPYTLAHNCGSRSGAVIAANGDFLRSKPPVEPGEFRILDAIFPIGEDEKGNCCVPTNDPQIGSILANIKGTSCSAVATACAIANVQEARRLLQHPPYKPYEARAHLTCWRAFHKGRELTHCPPDIFGWLLGTRVFHLKEEDDAGRERQASLDCASLFSEMQIKQHFDAT